MSDEPITLADRVRVQLCLMLTALMGVGVGMWLPVRLPIMGLVWFFLGGAGWLALIAWAVRDDRRAGGAR